jgi:hypothetical protein
LSEEGITPPPGTPDGIGESRAKAAITKIPVDPALKELAREKICAAVDGNKLDPKEVTVHAFEGELLRFSAETILEIRTKTAEKRQGGKVSGPIVVADAIALKDQINKEYLKIIESRDMARDIREMVLKRDDQGFAQENIVMPLSFWKKDFVIHEACNTCKSSGKSVCQRCNGLGWEICVQCRKKGMVQCPTCGGGQFVQTPDGGRKSCGGCHGRGEVPCPLCQRRGETQCRTCRTKGATQCPVCNGHGWVSHLHMVTADLRMKFDYDREVVPEKVQALMQRLGPKLKEHAKIEISQLQEHVDEDIEKKKISIHYNVELPYGHIEFALGRETFFAFLFGTQAKLTYVSAFLDKVIANGARKLKDSADSRGNVLSNLHVAGEYKTVRHAILATSRFSKAKAAKTLMKQTPLGLSKEMVQALINDSSRALKNVTRTARGTAFGIGLFSGSGILWLYYFFPLRPKIIVLLDGLGGINPMLHVAMDVGVVGLCAALCAGLVKIANDTAQGKALKEFLALEKLEKEEERKKKKANPDAPAALETSKLEID